MPLQFNSLSDALLHVPRRAEYNENGEQPYPLGLRFSGGATGDSCRGWKQERYN